MARALPSLWSAWPCNSAAAEPADAAVHSLGDWRLSPSEAGRGLRPLSWACGWPSAARVLTGSSLCVCVQTSTLRGYPSA